MLIDSIPIPTRLERDNIIGEKNFELVLPYLTAAAKRLEQGGADFVVLACNSLHIFEKEIAACIDVPFMSIVEATLQFIGNKQYRTVGLLGTYKINSSSLYTKPLKAAGIQVVKLNEYDQKLLSRMIVRIINHQAGVSDSKLLTQLLESMKTQGAETVILACTDLHIVLELDKKPFVVDSLEILAQAAAKIMQA